MQIPTRLLVVPLLIGSTGLSALSAQVAPAGPAARATTDSIVTVRWNRLAPRLADEAAASRRAARKAAAGDYVALRRLAMTPPPFLFRVYTLLSVAQYAAANAARENRAASADVAIAAASAGVLADLFTDSAVRSSIALALARDINRARTGARETERTAAGRSLGEDVARRVIAWAPPIDFAAGSNVTIPTGPGMWYSVKGVPPMGTFFGKSRTWLLDSAGQFRPAPPPKFDSPQFQAALDEVRRVARERTPEQTRIARLWSDADPWAMWNDIASAVLVRNRVSDVKAARILAVLNAAASDAVIACFDAKYHYWTIRPSQADTTLVLADSVGLPNFPSYPSGHACTAGAFDAVLGYYFPRQRAEFTRVAEEQAMSRLYGGIHYRFDNDIGLDLGRAVGRHAVNAERRGALRTLRTAGGTSKP